MKFNEHWTKEVNDKYRQMIKDHKSIEEIKDTIGDKMEFHPNGKFNKIGILKYDRFKLILEEIKFNPNYVYFEWRYIQSPRYKYENDIIFFFKVNDIEYIMILELFYDDLVGKHYNVFFTTKYQHDKYIKMTKDLISPDEYESKYKELQDVVEKETNYGDTIKIFNSLSYILLKYSSQQETNLIFTIFSEDDRKINFYIKSIEDSFKDKCEIKNMNGQKYFFLKNERNTNSK